MSFPDYSLIEGVVLYLVCDDIGVPAVSTMRFFNVLNEEIDEIIFFTISVYYLTSAYIFFWGECNELLKRSITLY